MLLQRRAKPLSLAGQARLQVEIECEHFLAQRRHNRTAAASSSTAMIPTTGPKLSSRMTAML